MFFRVAVFSILFVSVQAGFFDDVSGMASDVGDFFTKQFNGVKDLFAGNQSELEKNINRVKDLLAAVQEKAKMLEPLASDTQKKTLGQIDTYSKQVDQFQKEVKEEGSAKFEENKSKWENMVKSIFEKGGLEDLLKLLNIQSSSAMLSLTSITLVIAYFF